MTAGSRAARGTRRLRCSLWRLLIVGVAAVTACQLESSTSVERAGGAAVAARGGGSGNSAPAVNSVDPAQAPQDTIIDVNIFGSGFTRGARATWSLDGDTTQVIVESTKLVSSGQLVARIRIQPTAVVASYDVIVTLTDGKKGVGAEMFAVLQGDPEPAFHFPLDDAALGLRSDRLFVSGGSSVYSEDVCGVTTRIFVGGTGDGRMQTDNPKYTNRKCRYYPRMLTVDYGDGVVEAQSTAANVLRLHAPDFQVPVGSTMKRGLNVADGRCQGLRFKADLFDGTPIPGDSVLVTRIDNMTWRVETQPYPNNKAYCMSNGSTYHIAVRFTVVSDRPVP